VARQDQRLGGFGIDDQFELGGQIGRFGIVLPKEMDHRADLRLDQSKSTSDDFERNVATRSIVRPVMIRLTLNCLPKPSHCSLIGTLSIR
jgi:hypothetical protein